MQTAARCFDLPPRYSPAEDDELLEFLRQNAGQPVRIDASALRSVDGLLLELLLISARHWQGSGQEFRVDGVSSHIDGELALLGVAPEQLARGADK